MKPAIWGNASSLISNAVFCFEATHGYFAVRSSMASRPDFQKVLFICFAMGTGIFLIQGFSFYMVGVIRNF